MVAGAVNMHDLFIGFVQALSVVWSFVFGLGTAVMCLELVNGNVLAASIIGSAGAILTAILLYYGLNGVIGC